MSYRSERSAFIEQLILLANDLALAPQVHELLGVMATRAGMARTQFLEMLVLKAETVVNWKPPRLRSPMPSGPEREKPRASCCNWFREHGAACAARHHNC